MTATFPFLQWHLIVAYGFGLLLLLLVGRLIIGPLTWIIRTLLMITWSGLLGLFVIILFNIIGAGFDLYIPLNPMTALVVGFLKLPGLALLIVLQHLV